jgi:hypothetical protein
MLRGIASLHRHAVITLAVTLCGIAACATGNEGTSDGDGADGSTSQGGAGSGSGGAGGGTCTPGTEEPCYSGPDGTEDVGVCAGGTRTCSDEGTFGACAGEVVPAEEDCAAPEDEDCDGDAPLCAGAALWAKGWGDGSKQQVTGIAVDAEGNLILVGYFSGTIDFGGAPLTSAGLDVFVAKLDMDGNHLWSKKFGDAAEQYANGVAVDSEGNIFVVGEFKGTIDLGFPGLASSGDFDIFLVKLASMGSQLWVKRFGDGAAQSGEAVAVDSADGVAITGSVDGTVNFGGGNLAPLGGADIFVARFDKTGVPLHSSRHGDSSSAQSGLALATIGQDLVVAGSFLGTATFGGAPITSAGGADLFVARFGPSGAHVWSKGFGSTGDQFARAVGTDASSNILLTGSFYGSLTFGGSTFTSAGENDDMFVTKLDGAGAHVWSKQFGDTDAQIARGLDVDGGGNVVLTGGFGGELDFGGGALTSAGAADVFVARLDPSGTHLSSHSFGSTLDQIGRAIAVDPEGDLVVTGDFEGTIDFGTGELPGAGDFDVFLAKFAP